MNLIRIIPIVLLIAVFVIGCGNQNAQEEVVTWAQLRVLDELSESAMSHTGTEDSAEFTNTVAELFGAAKLLCSSEPPANAKNLEQVKLLQTDLSGLIGDDPASLNQKDLNERIEAIHAVAVKLMEAAGMPHVHDHDHEHEEHDHEEHDHEEHEGHNH